jgi:hypothetical protein
MVYLHGHINMAPKPLLDEVRAFNAAKRDRYPTESLTLLGGLPDKTLGGFPPPRRLLKELQT